MNWSRIECELIVDDYFSMLAAECKQQTYSKAEHRRRLIPKLSNRSEGSVEFKHQNISAVLIHAGYIYIRGYKPAWNYQELLETVVLERMASNYKALTKLESALIDQATSTLEIADPESIIVSAPDRIPTESVADRRTRAPRFVDYATRESRNRVLGENGEAFVLQLERRRLERAGRADLLGDLEWTSKVRGDGTGYDIRSFKNNTDEPLYIEVKTTNSGKYQPFMISPNELEFSSEAANQFVLYRLFDFSKSPGIFVLDGAVGDHVHLAPTMYRASF